MATIHIDGKEYEVDGTENLLEACLSLGLNVPYFCWHPALGSVGSCRQCAVKQYQNPDDKRGRLVMSCMTPAQDGVYISIEDEEAVKFRKALIEFTMTNHPHDCPVCEEGGNCHLQDMTVMSGQNNRRYRFNKRTHNNQDLGPFINHEMNRCIACYRCVRYYRDYAEGTDFGVYGSHDNVYFGRINSGTLDNEFSGNLVEVCPTGVFTDKTHSERFNRKWDMQFSPSICQQCSVGCNTSPGERYGELRRIENRFNGSVNHYFLCDRGRFGYGYVNLKDRPRQPQLKQADTWHIINKQEAIEAAKSILEFAKGVVAIGSPRASLESNFALRELVGAENFYSGIDANEQALLGQIQMILRESGIHTPTLREIERYDAVVVLGEDVTQTAARVSLAIRQALKGKSRELAAAQRVPEWSIAAVQNIGQGAKHPLFITSLDSTRLDDVAASVYHGSIADQARYGFALAHAIDNNAPEVTGFTSELNEKIQHVADVLKTAKHPLIVSGTALKDKSIIQAAANIAKALKASGCEQVGLTFITGEANSMGLALMNAKPIEKAFEQFANDNADTLVVMENDLYRRASEEIVNRALAKAENIIVIDHQHTDIMARADLIISAASFAEGDGTLVNHEGRVQRFFQVFDPSFYDKRHLDASGRALPEDTTDLAGKSIILESWRWLSAVKSVMANKNGADWTTLDHVMGEFAQVFPDLGAILTTAPDAQFRIRGMRVARQPSRYSGRTSMNANVSIHEQRQPVDNDSAFVFSMEGYMGTDVPRQQIPFAWSPGWNSPQAWNKFQDEVGGSLRAGDPGVRLFEKAAEASLTYFQPIVASNKTDSLTVVPYYHLFGSEELSQRSEVIQQRMPEAYVILNQQDAQKMSLTEGGYVKLSCQAQHFELKVKISKNLASGLVGLPIGLPKLSPSLIGAQVETLQEVSQ